MRLSEVASIVHGRIQGVDAEFQSVGIDTRSELRNQLYIALRGDRFDGHAFVYDACQAGASAAMVEVPQEGSLPQLVVKDTRRALGDMARHWRFSQFQGVMVGVTGSNGKTTVKEMIAAVLGEPSEVGKTRGNRNNDIGVPLTLLELGPQHRFAVIEMGANHPGEIAYVARLTEPDIGVITGAAPAHLEGFGSVEGVARAKGELIEAISAQGTVVLNADDPFMDMWAEMAGSRRRMSFGVAEADVRIEESAPLEFCAGRFRNRFQVAALGERFAVDLPLAGSHNMRNALAAIACALAAGRYPEDICAGLAALEPVPGRLRPVPAQQGGWLLDDSYNANPASFAAGLDTLLSLGGEPWIILGGFEELGVHSVEWHRDCGRLSRSKGVYRLLAVGEATRHAVASFGGGGKWFASKEALIEEVAGLIHPDARILVKGSRSQRMETVVEALGVQ